MFAPFYKHISVEKVSPWIYRRLVSLAESERLKIDLNEEKCPVLFSYFFGQSQGVGTLK